MVHTFSNKMRQLVQLNVNRPVFDSSTDHNVYFGFPWRVIHDEVLDMGLADFRTPYIHEEYGTLSPKVQVLMYCFSNMKRYFFEACVHTARRQALQPVRASSLR